MELKPSVESSPAAKRIYKDRAKIRGLVDRDNQLDDEVTGGLNSFEGIYQHWVTNRWDAYTVPLSQDAASYSAESDEGKKAVWGKFGTLFRAEAVVDEWMPKMVEASALAGDRALTLALFTQEFDEKMHKDSIARVGREVLGIKGADWLLQRKARQSNNFVAEKFFKTFEKRMSRLLDKPEVSAGDFYEAVFIYGIISEDAVANNDAMIRRAHQNDTDFAERYPGMDYGQKNVRRDEGRHVRIAFLATRDFLVGHPGAKDRLGGVTTEYLDLAEDMFLRAKNTRGLIDSYLREAYGPDVDSLYYYVTNLTRLASRLSQLGLTEMVNDTHRRVEWAISRFTDEAGEPVIESPDEIARKFGRLVLLTGAARKPKMSSKDVDRAGGHQNNRQQ